MTARRQKPPPETARGVSSPEPRASLIDGERAKELHHEAYAHRLRCTVCAAILCLAGGSLVTWKVLAALPLMGVPVGILSAAALIFITMIVWALTEPVSHDLEEFAELMADELRR